MSIPRPPVRTVVTLAAIAALASCDRDAVGPLDARPEPERAALEVSAAATNDDFDDAVVVSELPFTHTTDTSEATTAFDDPFCVGQGPTVWYAFTPSVSGFYQANTFDSEYDTTLSAYLGERGSLLQIACNDDAQGLQSQVIVELEAGVTVYFMVGAFASGPGGPLVFNLSTSEPPPPPPPPPPPLEGTLSIDRFGTFDPRTGDAWLFGGFTCSRFAFVDIFGSVRTRVGRLIAESFFSTSETCDGAGRWEAFVRAQNVAFAGGPVTVTVQAFFFDPWTGDSEFEQIVTTVILRGGGGSGGGNRSGRSVRSSVEPGSFRSLSEMLQHDPMIRKGMRRQP